MGTYDQPPNLARLIERLRQINQDVSDTPTAEECAAVINASLSDQAVCSRAIVDGKPKALTFSQYWSAVFQQKWVYVRQEERARPIGDLKL